MSQNTNTFIVAEEKKIGATKENKPDYSQVHKK